jgi:hypothetical protein
MGQVRIAPAYGASDCPAVFDAQASASEEQAALGKTQRSTTKIHWTVR